MSENCDLCGGSGKIQSKWVTSDLLECPRCGGGGLMKPCVDEGMLEKMRKCGKRHAGSCCKCPDCDGEGEVTVADEIGLMEYGEIAQCERCGGTGSWKPPREGSLPFRFVSF